MEILNEIYELVCKAIEFYFNSGLAKDTAMAGYNTLKDIVLPLMLEYIEILF